MSQRMPRRRGRSGEWEEAAGSRQRRPTRSRARSLRELSSCDVQENRQLDAMSWYAHFNSLSSTSAAAHHDHVGTGGNESAERSTARAKTRGAGSNRGEVSRIEIARDERGELSV